MLLIVKKDNIKTVQQTQTYKTVGQLDMLETMHQLMIIQIYTVLEDLERARIINGHSINLIQTYKKVVYLKYSAYINLNIKKK